MCKSHKVSPDLPNIAHCHNGPGSCASPELEAPEAELEAELDAPEAEVETGHVQTSLEPKLEAEVVETGRNWRLRRRKVGAELEAPEAEVVETGHAQTRLEPQWHEKMLAPHVNLHSAMPLVLACLGPGSVSWCNPDSAMVWGYEDLVSNPGTSNKELGQPRQSATSNMTVPLAGNARK